MSSLSENLSIRSTQRIWYIAMMITRLSTLNLETQFTPESRFKQTS